MNQNRYTKVNVSHEPSTQFSPSLLQRLSYCRAIGDKKRMDAEFVVLTSDTFTAPVFTSADIFPNIPK
ncbi:hypothetical protein M378DRAFT_290744 [Amanita muscaria Koide BX008]|uniref:Uncharacterized protein n=1 Tax=Amanita muscaria (strain Koide BX008) TaxID=946122 RepID=A0A0C2WRB1_AMAMK|nr:hypothetical protein M378DRAFT_290744 [Amanita muscaria Koide BX008]